MDLPAPKRGSFFLGFLVGFVTIVVSLVMGYWTVGSLNEGSATGNAGESAEPWIFLVIVAIPITASFFYWKLGEYRATIGVVVASVAIFGPLFWFFGCLVGWTCHFELTSMRY